MRTNRTTTIASLNSLVSGLKENQPKGLFLIAGGRYTAAQLAKILQSIVTSMQAIPIAKGAHQKAIRSSRALLLQHHDVVVQLKQSLQMQAHDDTERLASYGLVPRKPTGGASPATLVAAADKAKATRAARHTMGSRQKRRITGASVAAAAAQVVMPDATASPGVAGAASVTSLK